MSSISNIQRCWAVLLAGGDGTRLQSLTLNIERDARPKQFCRLWGGKSLLAQTQERLEPLFPRSRTMFVVTRTHEEFYREDLWGVDDPRIVAQPQNRGTGVAIATALLRILQQEVDPLVAFFPSDHYYSDDHAFAHTVRSAMTCARQHSESIILLGAEAHYPEVEYGWIEPGCAIEELPVPVSRVNRFWEKPSLPEARALLGRGCLWNTFVTIGQARVFLDLLLSRIPDVMLNLAAGVTHDSLDARYRAVHPVDFSREVLVPLPHRMLVVHDTASGWADLGNPRRVIDTLVRNHIEPRWLSEMPIARRAEYLANGDAPALSSNKIRPSREDTGTDQKRAFKAN
jgi:mannose-1-phosphate guanylyltransferase